MKRANSFLQAGGQAAAAEEEEADDDLHGMVATDAEATIMLLRQKLYPDPAQAAAAASAAKQSRHAKRSKGATGPSKATAAAITAAAAAAAAAKQLPPIVLKSQLYTVLTDKTTADRDLENLRQKGRVRVFKLAIGADEYVLLLADDFNSILNRLIQQYQHLSAQHTPQPQAPTAAPSAASDPCLDSSPGENASIAATLQLFRDRVVPAWRDASIPAPTLLQLLRTPTSTSPAPAETVADNSRPAAAAAAAGSAGGKPAHERHLLALDLMTRDIRNPDSYVLTVPGAAAFVRSVTAGRQELLQLLARKKYNELLEKELVCVKLRNSCLTPSFIARDLQGRGLITVTDTTAGPLLRLAQRK